jgi:hypothetical protein
VLRTLNDGPTLWESILPASLLGMPAELESVDRLLDDPRFFEPYRRFLDARLGRPSVPIETYLRLMFLKYRYRLGFEPLCREVSDSISWQRFIRVPLGGRVPHPTTLMKITLNRPGIPGGFESHPGQLRLGPVPSAPGGGFVLACIHGDLGAVELDDAVMGSHDQAIEHADRDPPRSPCTPDRRTSGRASRWGSGVIPPAKAGYGYRCRRKNAAASPVPASFTSAALLSQVRIWLGVKGDAAGSTL